MELAAFVLIIVVNAFTGYSKSYPTWSIINDTGKTVEVECKGIGYEKANKLKLSYENLFPDKSIKHSWKEEYTIGRKLRGAQWECYSGNKNISFKTYDEEEVTLIVANKSIKIIREK